MSRLMVLEWNQAAPDIAGYEQMLREETEWACWFCYSSAMVPGHGLLDEQGNPTPELFAFRRVNTMTAIDERAQQLGEATLGAPLGPEVELAAGVKMKPFYNGVLVEIPNAGVYALSEATVADGFLPRPA